MKNYNTKMICVDCYVFTNIGQYLCLGFTCGKCVINHICTGLSDIEKKELISNIYLEIMNKKIVLKDFKLMEKRHKKYGNK